MAYDAGPEPDDIGDAPGWFVAAALLFWSVVAVLVWVLL